VRRADEFVSLNMGISGTRNRERFPSWKHSYLEGFEHCLQTLSEALLAMFGPIGRAKSAFFKVLLTCNIGSDDTSAAELNRQQQELNMTNGKRLIGAALIAMAFTSLMSTPAKAETEHYPGGACVRTSGGTYERYFGTIFNSSTTTELNVFCPFVRIGAFMWSAAFVVFDRNPNANVWCTLSNEVDSGNNIYLVSHTAKTSGFSDTRKVLNFPKLDVYGGQHYDGGYYYANCIIPPALQNQLSHIVSFHIDEQPEDGNY
jgi:hypothetical protein